VSSKSALHLCLRGRLSRLGFTALLAAGLWGFTGSGSALAQQTQAPLTLPGPGGETNVVADRIQQVGGGSDLFLATGNVEITRGNNRLVADRVELNRATGEVLQGRVPPYSVVVSGAMPGKALPNNSPGPSLYCAVIVKTVDERTRAKTSINELLRD